MPRINRRAFLQYSASASAALALPATSWSRVLGSGEDIRLAFVGLHGRGWGLLGSFAGLSGVRIVALCDCDRKVLEKRSEELAKKKIAVEGFVDIRKMLEQKDIDAVVIATPNHWHSTMAIWAMQAGKDVYVEKPVSHNVREGRLLVETASKLGRIIQCGTQSRSSTGLMEAVEYLRSGALGKIRLARGLCYKPRMSIGKVDGPQTVPDHIDYDLWLGPSPSVPLMRKSLHYDWHWDFNTGNGDLGNQGIHQMDIARWILGEERLSPRVMSIGGRVGYDDDGNTPNTMVAYHDYPAAPLIFEVRGLPESRKFQADAKLWKKNMPRYRKTRIGVVVDCEGGTLEVPTYDSAIAYDPEGKELRSFKGSGNHSQNFIDAVRSRRSEDLNGQIENGHLSSALCHTANISFLLGKQREPGEIREAIRSTPAAVESLERMLDHLKANEVDLGKRGLSLGPWLAMDPQTERFTGDEEADRLLQRKNREPYTLTSRL